MKYSIGKRGETAIEAKKVIIHIGQERYRLTESVDGRLTINKISEGENDSINVHPRYANEIDVS